MANFPHEIKLIEILTIRSDRHIFPRFVPMIQGVANILNIELHRILFKKKLLLKNNNIDSYNF